MSSLQREEVQSGKKYVAVLFSILPGHFSGQANYVLFQVMSYYYSKLEPNTSIGWGVKTESSKKIRKQNKKKKQFFYYLRCKDVRRVRYLETMRALQPRVVGVSRQPMFDRMPMSARAIVARAARVRQLERRVRLLHVAGEREDRREPRLWKGGHI